jgi:hypothetical protein
MQDEEEVDRARLALVVRDVLDPELLDLEHPVLYVERILWIELRSVWRER